MQSARAPGMRRMSVSVAGLAALATLAMAGCGEFPRDPEGTLERARGGVLRAGAVAAAPWVVVGPNGTPSGAEAELVEAFARSIDARVEWRVAGADEVLRAIERRELDVAIGGFTKKSPWAPHIGMTRPWRKDGDDERVLAVAAGENATLFALDRLIAAREGQR
ncbi:MAG TPA: transporter substrate-binding domain-containing protein [Longimicrobiales bacterium]